VTFNDWKLEKITRLGDSGLPVIEGSTGTKTLDLNYASSEKPVIPT